MANKSRFIRNINAVAESRYSKAAGKIAVKGIEKTAKWMVTDHIGATRHSSLIGLQQSSNFAIAEMELICRRGERSNDHISKFISTGVEASTYEVALGWIIDHALYIWDLLWGFFEPIVTAILFVVFNSIVTVLFNVIFFYGIFWLLFS